MRNLNWDRVRTVAKHDLKQLMKSRDFLIPMGILGGLFFVVLPAALLLSIPFLIPTSWPHYFLFLPPLQLFFGQTVFFWLVLIATTGGLLLSFTRARELEGAGASRIGTVCLYLLVATIGMSMDVTAVFRDPGLFVVGVIWLAIHYALLLVVGKLIRAPFFFTAVGSQANVGGAASAPVIAAAFHPALAPVGVLLAVLGYAVGTYGALLCAHAMRIASGG